MNLRPMNLGKKYKQVWTSIGSFWSYCYSPVSHGREEAGVLHFQFQPLITG